MISQKNNHASLPFIAYLCAHLSDEETYEAEERFWGYIDIVRHIHARLEAEGDHPTP